MDNINKLDELGELGKQVRHWERHQKQKDAFLKYLFNYFYELGTDANLQQIRLRRLLPRLEKCGSYLLIRWYYFQNEQRVVSANFCKQHKLCGLCAIRRAAKGAMNLHDKANQVLANKPYLKPYYMVLTVKNEPNLADGMRKLKKGWERVRTKRKNAKRALATNHPENSKYASALRSEFARVIGGAYSIEITYNQETREWHPHMNLLLLSETTITKSNLEEEWEEYTGDSKITHQKELDLEEDKWAFCEIMKYAMKFSEMPFKQHIQAYLALLGTRLKGTIGEFYGVNLDPDLLDDTLEGQPYIEILLSYYKGKYHSDQPWRAGVEKSKKRKIYKASDLDFRAHILAPSGNSKNF